MKTAIKVRSQPGKKTKDKRERNSNCQCSLSKQLNSKIIMSIYTSDFAMRYFEVFVVFYSVDSICDNMIRSMWFICLWNKVNQVILYQGFDHLWRDTKNSNIISQKTNNTR